MTTKSHGILNNSTMSLTIQHILTNSHGIQISGTNETTMSQLINSTIQLLIRVTMSNPTGMLNSINLLLTSTGRKILKGRRLPPLQRKLTLPTRRPHLNGFLNVLNCRVERKKGDNLPLVEPSRLLIAAAPSTWLATGGCCRTPSSVTDLLSPLEEMTKERLEVTVIYV